MKATDSPPKITMVKAINMALMDAMDRDKSVVVLGEDVGDREEGGIVGVTRGLSGRFGDARVRSTPISEQAIVGAAIGAAMRGYRPVAEIMLMNFTTVAMDMIVNHAAKLRFMSGGQTHVPLTIRTMTGAGGGFGGQHGDYLESWFAHVAGLKVVAPSTPAEAYGLMLSCIEDDDPCIFIENTISLLDSSIATSAIERGVKIPLGKAHVVRPGSDITLVSYSRALGEVVAAADQMRDEGLSAEVIDLRSIAPLDMETIRRSALKTKRVLIVHEAARSFGPGAEIAARLQEELYGTLEAPIARVGAPYCPIPYSKPLEAAFIPNKEKIASAIINTLRG